MTTPAELDTRRAEGLAVLGDLPPDAVEIWKNYRYGVKASPRQIRQLYLAIRPLVSSDRAAMTEAIVYAIDGLSETLHKQEGYARSVKQMLKFTRAVIENLRRRAGAD